MSSGQLRNGRFRTAPGGLDDTPSNQFAASLASIPATHDGSQIVAVRQPETYHAVRGLQRVRVRRFLGRADRQGGLAADPLQQIGNRDRELNRGRTLRALPGSAKLRTERVPAEFQEQRIAPPDGQACQLLDLPAGTSRVQQRQRTVDRMPVARQFPNAQAIRPQREHAW